MSGLDIEGVLAGHRSAFQSGAFGRCSCGAEYANMNGAGMIANHRAHVAAVLREQIAAAQAEAWEAAVQALGWALHNGPSERAMPYVAEHNPYRAAQVAPSREEET